MLRLSVSQLPAAWDPAKTFGGCVLDVDLSDSPNTTITDGAIEAFVNRVSGDVWSEATANQRFALGEVNGLPAFQGAPSASPLPRVISTEAAVVAAIVDAKPYTLFYVAKATTTDVLGVDFGAGNSGVGNSQTRVWAQATAGTGGWRTQVINNAAATITSSTTSDVDANVHVHEWTSPGTTVTYTRDGTVTTINGLAHNPGTNTVNQVAIGIRPDNIPDTGMCSDLARLMLFSEDLTPLAKQRIRSRLACQFGLSVAGLSTAYESEPEAPLAGFWGDGGFWHAADLEYADTARVLEWAPREGSVSWTATDDTTAPTMDENGWFGAPGVAFDDANLQRMRADSLAALLAGSDLPLTVVIDMVPTKVNETMVTFSTNASSPYARFHTSASGNPVSTRSDGSTFAATMSLPNVLNGRQLLAFVSTGTTSQAFTDKKADTVKTQDAGSLGSLTQLVLGNFFRAAAAASGDSFDGIIRAVGITSRVLTEAQIEQLYHQLYPGQKRLWFLGDSITSGIGSTGGGGMRERLSDQIATNNYNVDLVGTIDSGTVWSRTKHDGNPGDTIADASAKVSSSFGLGLAVPHADLTLLLIGTNNMGFGVSYDGTTTPAAYGDLLDQIQAADPDTRLVVSTIPPVNAATYPTPAANVNDYNSKLPAIWDAFDLANPTRTLIRWDANACLGGTYSAGDFDDDVHPNDTGYDKMMNDATNGLLQAIAATLAAF